MSLSQTASLSHNFFQLKSDYLAMCVQYALLRLELAFDRAVKAGFNPGQLRVPTGQPDGGQWTDGDGDVIPAADDRPGNDRYLNDHILRDHVGKSDTELIARMKRETVRGRFASRIMDRNGAFASEEDARDLIRRTLDMNHEVVERVARGQLPRAFITLRVGSETGKEAYREPSDSDVIRMRRTYEVGVEIMHNQNSGSGYRIISAYPRNYNPRTGR